MKKIIGMLALSSISLLAVATNGSAEEMKEYESNAMVEFIPKLDPTLPVNPENPDPENPVEPTDPTNPEGPNPGTQGPLSIDYASSFDFGINRISNKDEVYFARAQAYNGDVADTANFVQISDNRGTNSGWTLKVKQDNPFTATTETLNDVLTGAEITLSSPAVSSNAQNVVAPIPTDVVTLTPGVEEIVTAAKDGSGAGTWATYWGNVEAVEETDEAGATTSVNVTKAVQLAVPGSTPKDAVEYQTKLVWTLTDVPGV